MIDLYRELPKVGLDTSISWIYPYVCDGYKESLWKNVCEEKGLKPFKYMW